MTVTIGFFILGLILIVKGGDWFVESSVSIAKATGLPQLFIGATIVSIATTLPEVIVSATAAVKNHTTMSIGNGLGSIICNIGLILAIVNIISPGRISGKVFNTKALLMLGYIGIFTILSYDRVIGGADRIILILMLIGYIILDIFILKYKQSQKNKTDKQRFTINERVRIGVFFIMGISFIITGANLLVNHGVVLAKYIGVPEAVISLTFIALGTSLPELASAITALRKGYTSLSIGNILGANILNISAVIGISSIIAPLKILKQNIFFDIPIAIILMAILVVPTMRLKKVGRVQGILMIMIYGAYLAVLYKLYI